ncbi:hypothetical protein [Halorubrum persicum]|uniref:hypothetical protein n=1 Tax=Halorubrum persicum TaxID=1383844 RepID=UPI001181AD6D|nr:hypothetical protein [Halorubrum persicum]
MRPRDDPADRGRYAPERRRGPDARERSRSRRGAGRDRTGSAPQGPSSPVLIPGVTLGALLAVATLAAIRSTGRVLREWSLAIAVCAVVAGCVLSAVVVAHIAAGAAARWGGAGR